MNKDNIIKEIPKEITFRIDSQHWIRIAEKIPDKILIRANRFGKLHVVEDTHRDRTQELDAEGFVRIKPKRIWNI